VANGNVYVPTGSNSLVVYGQITAANPAGSPVITGITNAASYASTVLAPGEILAIFGKNLGPYNLAQGAVDASSGKLGTQLSGTQVTFNGISAPLVYTSDITVGAVVPYEVAGAATVDVQVNFNGKSSAVQTVPLSQTIPGIFAVNSTGSGQGVILNEDSSLNSWDNPASAGSYVVLYATGGGQTSPASKTGSFVSGETWVMGPVTATINGVAAKVLYAGGAPTQLAGVLQVNLQLPAGVTGTVPVVITIAGQSSQETVTVTVQ
jgi:uncharacterized protein (TIGR03437 family)